MKASASDAQQPRAAIKSAARNGKEAEIARPIDLPSPHTLPLGARRWKLFLLVVVVLASLTTAAIVLTLRAHPHRGTLHAPAPQPVARAIPAARPPKSSQTPLS